MPDNPVWFDWAREIYSISQAGLAYSTGNFDIARYKRLQEISAEIIASQSGLALESVLQNFSMQAGYATPKVDVRAAIMRAGKILLVKEVLDGRWSMPGGWCDLGDSPAEMAAREVWEESGFTVRVDKLVGIYDGNRLDPLEFHHFYKLVFLCSITGGQAATSMESLAVDFFDPQCLPPLSENRTNQRILDEVFAHVIDAQRRAYFE